MPDHVKQTIADAQAKLKSLERDVLDQKRFINQLCKLAGIASMYGDTELNATSGPTLSIQGDQFYGQPLAGSIRVILEMRRALKQGPATVNDIYDALIAGGYKFETKNEDNSKRGLRVSLTKNTTTFHKLPQGTFGLLEWYPNAKQPKADEDDSDEEKPAAGAKEGKP